MLALDNTVLSDYLVGKRSAGEFLREYEHHEWAVPSVVLYEAYVGDYTDTSTTRR